MMTPDPLALSMLVERSTQWVGVRGTGEGEGGEEQCAAPECLPWAVMIPLLSGREDFDNGRLVGQDLSGQIIIRVFVIIDTVIFPNDLDILFFSLRLSFGSQWRCSCLHLFTHSAFHLRCAPSVRGNTKKKSMEKMLPVLFPLTSRDTS